MPCHDTKDNAGFYRFIPLSSAEAPAGYPLQNKIIEKLESARGMMGRAKNPARSLFLSLQPPHNTKRPLRRREDLYPILEQSQ